MAVRLYERHSRGVGGWIWHSGRGCQIGLCAKCNKSFSQPSTWDTTAHQTLGNETGVGEVEAKVIPPASELISKNGKPLTQLALQGRGWWVPGDEAAASWCSSQMTCLECGPPLCCFLIISNKLVTTGHFLSAPLLFPLQFNLESSFTPAQTSGSHSCPLS